MSRSNKITQQILEAMETVNVCTARTLSEELERKHESRITPGCASYRLHRLWKRGLIARSNVPITSKFEYMYSHRKSRNQKVIAELDGKSHEIHFVGYVRRRSSVPAHSPTRLLIKDLFDDQKKPEPLFPNEISLFMNENHHYRVNLRTLSSTLNKMVYKHGELARSKTRFENGFLYHPDSRVIEKWVRNPPYKGLSPDEKGLLQLIREKSVVTIFDIRREATKGKSSIPLAFATLSFKIRKLKELVPWVRTEYYASTLIVFDAKANPEVLEEKLKQTKFWLSEEGKRKAAYGHEFESFGTYIFYNIVHEESNEWYSTNIEVEKNKKGRFGEYDLLITHTFGPPEFGLKETLVIEFKTIGKVQWRDLFGYDPKKHSWGFIEKLEKEKQEGMFRGKFVRPILVLAHTIESGLPGEILKRGVVIIYLSELLEYLRRKQKDPDNILKDIHAKYYKP